MRRRAGLSSPVSASQGAAINQLSWPAIICLAGQLTCFLRQSWGEQVNPLQLSNKNIFISQIISQIVKPNGLQPACHPVRSHDRADQWGTGSGDTWLVRGPTSLPPPAHPSRLSTLGSGEPVNVFITGGRWEHHYRKQRNLPTISIY